MTNVAEEETGLSGPGAILPSGARLPLMNYGEQRYVDDRVGSYADDNKLSNISDLQELDRLIILELLVHRYGSWLGTGADYNNEPINPDKLGELVKNNSTEIRLLKKNLGMDRPARERAKGEGSIAHHWEQLKVRAGRFAIHRCKQLDKALELTNELIALVETHDRSTERERIEFHVTMEDIFDYIRTIYMPEYRAVDIWFQEHEQTYWVRDQ